MIYEFSIAVATLITEPLDAPRLSVFIHLNSVLKSEFTISIYDVLGKKVYSQKVDANSTNERISINTESFQSGMYQVAIHSENYFSNQKMIIQKQ